MIKSKFLNVLLMLSMGSVMFLWGCGDDDTNPPSPVAGFTFTVDEATGGTVTFANTSENATSYAWDFGDGNTSTDENPTNTYAANGDYTVELVASNSAGTTNSSSETITIVLAPVAGFTFTVDEATGGTVTFTNTSENATSYAWDFGDGNTSTDENPENTYAANGDYTVELVASNSAGTTNSSSETITIVLAPVAGFTFTVDEETGGTATFTNTSENATSYAWDFGDGNTSTDENPTNTYAANGDYTVELVASNSAGTTNSSSETITIVLASNEKLDLLAGSTSKTWKLVRDGASMLLASDATLATIWWPGITNNGDRPCLYDDSFTFSNDGTFAFDDASTFWAEFGIFNGVSGCDANTTPEGCIAATAANLVNECGDDISAWLSNSAHSYTFDTDEDKITLTGNGAWIGIPKLATDMEVRVPQPSVTFNARLGDGGSSGVDTLYASYDYGTAGYWMFTYVSYDDANNEPNLVSVKAGFTVSTAGFTSTFTNTSSGAVSYSWDFGDNSGTSTEENPVYIYTTAGTYTVTLTASDASGASQTSSTEVTVPVTAPSGPASTPAQADAGVISIFSDAYTSITGVNTNPDWGQATVTTEEEIVTGDKVLKMAGLNYQGIDFAANQQDVSGKTMVHIDVWAASAESVNFFLISAGPAETPYVLSITAGEWNSFDIALTEYSSVVDLAQIIQFKFDEAPNPGAGATIYVDNIYFY